MRSVAVRSRTSLVLERDRVASGRASKASPPKRPTMRDGRSDGLEPDIYVHNEGRALQQGYCASGLRCAWTGDETSSCEWIDDGC